MEDEKDICPICGGGMTETVINYSDWSDGHLLVVRDVPVRECQPNGHRFFRADTARALERLFDLDRQSKLAPIEFMQVPVVSLELAT